MIFGRRILPPHGPCVACRIRSRQAAAASSPPAMCAAARSSASPQRSAKARSPCSLSTPFSRNDPRALRPGDGGGFLFRLQDLFEQLHQLIEVCPRRLPIRQPGGRDVPHINRMVGLAEIPIGLAAVAQKTEKFARTSLFLEHLVVAFLIFAQDPFDGLPVAAELF